MEVPIDSNGVLKLVGRLEELLIQDAVIMIQSQ